MSRVLLLTILVTCPEAVFAEELDSRNVVANESVSAERLRGAVLKAIPHLESGTRVSARERTCFTCHNQGVAVFALKAASLSGFAVDQENLQHQLQHTWKHLNRGKSGYEAGKGQGGQTLTAGYALWTLETGAWGADETTSAVVNYLIDYQKDRGHWIGTGRRPPSSGSSMTATYVALRGISHYGSAAQKEQFDSRRQAVTDWLVKTSPVETEDAVFRLRSLPYLGLEKEVQKLEIQKAVQSLLAEQQSNGGWRQKLEMLPDAYATGTVLTALQEVGHLEANHPALQAGCRFLLESQLEDGTWRVTTRAVPIQDYYESGFPHDEDQYISITASGWAVMALCHTLNSQPVAINQSQQNR